MDRRRISLYASGGVIMKDKVYDVAIIGGGILGAMIAWKLSSCQLDLVVLEQGYDIGEGAAKANSGILYPGLHARGGSLKGISTVQGNAMYDTICETLGIPLHRTGSLYVAFSEEGVEKMMKKYERGLRNGAPDMQILSGEEARQLEPLLSPDVIRAVYSPNTALISPFILVTAMAEAAASNGVEFRFGCRVSGIQTPGNRSPFFSIRTAGESISARYVVNTAGGGAASVEQFVREQNLVIQPRRGQYFIFDPPASAVIRHVLFQAGDNDEGGTLIAPTVDGNIIAGPTSEDVKSFQDTETTAEGLAHVERVARKIIPSFPIDTAVTSFAGIRANITNIEKEQKDFVIRRSVKGMASALGIKNPGMTAAPYLTEQILEIIREDGLATIPKEKLVPYRWKQPFLSLSRAEQQELWRNDPRYGHVLCRCEKITEGDLLRVLDSPLPPISMDGLKKRLRIGMGRCQGSYCISRVMEVLCRERKCEPQEILKRTEGSFLVKGRLK